MPDDTELLEQRVIKRKQKLEEAGAVVSMIQERLASASAADEEAGRELRTLRAALKSAEKKAKRLKKRTKQAEALAGSVEQDRLLAERELAEELQSYEKRQGKLAKAEAALAAAQATQRVDDVAPPEATPAKKAPASKSTPAKRSAATKQAAPRKRAAAAKKTASTTGRTTSTASTAKKATRQHRQHRQEDDGAEDLREQGTCPEDDDPAAAQDDLTRSVGVGPDRPGQRR